MDYPMALAIIGSVAFVAGGGASVFKTLYGNGVCKEHACIASDIASLKNVSIKLAVYVADKATQEGRNLEQETIQAMMRRM